MQSENASGLLGWWGRHIEGLSFTHVRMWDLSFFASLPDSTQKMLNVVACLLLLAALAHLCRSTIYFLIRLGGVYVYTPYCQVFENTSLVAAFAAGFICGLLALGNVFFAGLTGFAFVVYSVGATLEGVVANEKTLHERRNMSILHHR